MRAWWIRLYTRRCKGCQDPSFHTAHLTWLGHRHYVEGKRP